MNRFLRNLNKIEFVVTDACTGKCKHCQCGESVSRLDKIDPSLAGDCVRKIAKEYDIKTVMAFGGEPLLHPDAVYAIISSAKEMNVPKRQVITNGYFSNDRDKIRVVAKKLSECGVNDLLVSVDAFHQETIPICVVEMFIEEARSFGIPMRLQPAWLVSISDDNIYNVKTREILDRLSIYDIPVGDGNIVFPEGNALKYLSEYFSDNIPENPYTDDPYDVRCISFSANGDVLSCNAYSKDICEIIKDYAP